MKQIISFIFSVLAVQSGAQMVTPAIIGNNTLQATVNNITFEFSMGEPATLTISNNYIITQGFLQPQENNINIILPVRGLQFSAKRIDPAKVQLGWKTLQEINNLGFYIERKKENEVSFSTVGFRPSLAPGGNSSFPLEYTEFDNNNFTGKTYYRLKQEDLDGRTYLSVVRIVNGKADKEVNMQVWPIPSTDYVNVRVSGIDNPVKLLVMDMNGKLVKEQMINNDNSEVKLLGLSRGSYILRLSDNKDLVQKIIIQ